jgi:hypothetical protein
MINIKETLKKPSAALRAMVDGLNEQSQRADFGIDMDTFGQYDSKSKKCFGCAATCAIQHIAKKDISSLDIENVCDRARILSFNEGELSYFEATIDNARVGYTRPLFDFFNMGSEYSGKFDDQFCLSSYYWKDEIPKVEKLISELEAVGL